MSIVSRPLNHNEPDLLIGNEHQCLIIKDLDSNVVAKIHAPHSGYTHDLLESVDYFAHSPDGWEAYLGSVWIGSSEV